jgi:HAD superfamily hydrolase (TIGR01509 family)
MALIDAILIDFDGTLFDSEDANAASYKEALANMGYFFTHEVIKNSINGRHWSFFLNELLGKDYSESIGLEISTAKKLIFPKYLHQIGVNNYLLSFLDTLDASILKGLVSNSSRSSLMSVLIFYDMQNYFDVIVSQDDVSLPKPSPEGYLLALNKLNIPHDRCLAVEDSPVGVIAAQMAKISVLKIAPFLKIVNK